MIGIGVSQHELNVLLTHWDPNQQANINSSDDNGRFWERNP